MKFFMAAFLSAAIIASSFVAKAEEAKLTIEETKTVAKKSLSQGAILDLLNDAASKVQMGGIYCSSYIPSDLYQVVTVALDQNENQVVVYQALFGVNAVWVRPVSEFVELVNVDGAVVPHFQLVDEFVSADEDLVTDVVVAESLVADEVEQAQEEAVLEAVEADLAAVENAVEEEAESL